MRTTMHWYVAHYMHKATIHGMSAIRLEIEKLTTYIVHILSELGKLLFKSNILHITLYFLQK